MGKERFCSIHVSLRVIHPRLYLVWGSLAQQQSSTYEFEETWLET